MILLQIAALSITRTDRIAGSRSSAWHRSFRPRRFIAYFQAYTNTYAPVDYAWKLCSRRPSATRTSQPFPSAPGRTACPPDDSSPCSPGSTWIKPVSVELGLQTIHDSTAAFIRRGYALSCFEDACADAPRSRHWKLSSIRSLDFPEKRTQMMLDTIHYLNTVLPSRASSCSFFTF